MDVQMILAGKIAFGETEVVDGIQEVGLSDAVAPADTHNPFREAERGLPVVLELHQRYLSWK